MSGSLLVDASELDTLSGVSILAKAANTPAVSVVMSVFNGQSFLRESVASILDQSFTNFEVIVIDDGSTDDSPAILEEYRQRDPRIRVVHQENRGLVAALNVGCGMATGRYIARMDADDIALPDRLQRQLDFFRRHPDMVLLGGAVKFIDSSGSPLRTARQPVTGDEIRHKLRDGCTFWHPTVMFSAHLFRELGGYRYIYDAEDYDLWLRMAERGAIANLPDVLLQYRIHSQQVSVVRCKSQALGTLAAKAAATLRASGAPDPFETPQAITESTLHSIGTTQAEVCTRIARGYLASLRNMCLTGSDVAALEVISLLHSSEFTLAEQWVIADSELCGAKLLWRRRDYVRSVHQLVAAILRRPALLGRPLRMAIRVARTFTAGVVLREFS